MLFEFILFALLGWCVFVPATPARNIFMIVFIVLMVLWVALGIGPVVSSNGWGHLFR